RARAFICSGGIRAFPRGRGFGVVERKGSQVNDLMYKKEDGTLGFRTNNSGGLLGGITSGADLVVRIAIKPTSSISQVQDTVDKEGEKTQLRVKGRHDPCLCPRAVPIAEAMVNLVLLDHLLISKLSTI
ncbi:MAG: chorismate synthase, partial [Candidatus Dadabacteria bacterium]|nr:chorismate synthase [Candidatus Dadabacteria bacterium]